jgi:hypothetical protein
MPRTCTVCQHQDRSAIDSALIGNGPMRIIADRYGLSKTAVLRHKATHLPQHLAKAKQVSEVASASNLVDELLKLTKKTRDVLSRALRGKHYDLALKAIGRLEKQLELKARLLGELEDRGVRGDTRIEVVYIDKAVIGAGAPARRAIAAESELRG